MFDAYIVSSPTQKRHTTILKKWQADNRGLLSRSVWSKQGRIVKEDAVADAVVLSPRAKPEKIQPPAMPHELVVGDDGRHLLVVPKPQWWEVFAEAHTAPKAAELPVTSTLLSATSSSPPPPFPPLDAPSVPEFDVTREKSLVLRRKQSAKRRQGIISDSWAYVPEGLTAQDRVELGQDLELAYCVMHLIHYFRVTTHRPPDAWIDLNTDYCARQLGGKGKRNWYRVRDAMIGAGILEMTKLDIRTDDYGLGVEVAEDRGVKGGRCYGYRLREDLRRSTFRKTSLADPEAIKVRDNGVRGYADRWLYANLTRLTIEPVPDHVLLDIASADEEPGNVQAKVDSYREQVRWIQDGAWRFKRDPFSARLHTNVTNLKRQLRAYLRVAGRWLAEIDIRCCQPLLIGWLAKAAGYVDERYLRLCETDLYQFLADKLGVPREVVKRQLTQRALFSSNRSKHQQTPVMRLFVQEFPEVARYIRKVKAGRKLKQDDKPHNELAKAAQAAEVAFMLKVVARVRRERPGCFLTPIHDSFLCFPDDADYVKVVMSETFAGMQLSPQLEVKRYAQGSD